jgi:flagellar basal body-associated protein FliL
MLRVREQSTYGSRPAANGRDHVTILWIILIVILVLAVLGYFGRGRLSR